MSIDQYGINIGPLTFHFYGIILMLGVVAGGFVARRLLDEMGEEDPDLVWDALVWVLILGVVGARLYHVFTPSQSLLARGIDTRYYLTHPLDLIAAWNGGLGMPGAIVGGLVGLLIFSRRHGVQFTRFLDAFGPGTALGQAIGRWGNFVNQELYGPPSSLPWAIRIDPVNRLAGYEAFETFHPLFLYESIWNFANLVFLVAIWRRYRRQLMSGDLFLIYLITYPVGRFLLEFLRIDYVPMFGINFNQGLMLLVALASGAFLLYRHRRGAQAAS